MQTNTTLKQYEVIRRNGQITFFDPNKIQIALTKAFLAVEGDLASTSKRVHEIVSELVDQIMCGLTRRLPDGGIVHIEDIQDQVELALMRGGHHKVARAYVIYRDQQARMRAEQGETGEDSAEQKQAQISVVEADGTSSKLELDEVAVLLTACAEGLSDIDAALIYEQCTRNLYDGMNRSDVDQALILGARPLIDTDPNYGFLAARLLLNAAYGESLTAVNLGIDLPYQQAEVFYPDYFKAYLKHAVSLELLDPRLLEYDLDKLATAIKPVRDLQFNYLGLQTLYDRYLISSVDVRIEMPQAFFMRVAMGLAINEVHREARTIEFYELLSSFHFMSSTPTLFNSGTLRPQLSSCYLTTIDDDLGDIYSSLRDNALLSKFAGGLGNDWTKVRGLGAHIKGTNGNSQGIVPFLKVANDTAVAVNQGGKRKGAVCAYLETWHIDIEEFLELRKNTGDERRRTHDMNTANWVPDLFMARVAEDQQWTLFSPEEVPSLHELYGQAFKEAYEAAEVEADKGNIKLYRRVSAVELWRKMLSQLFETGHPWITFKDPCNVRYTNQHVGVVHSSNLCTEITLHTSSDEIAVCNLGSINLARHIKDGSLDRDKVHRSVKLAMRMLDNVIDYNYYAVASARNSNLQHRPVGLGIMGFQDALYDLDLAYGTVEAVQFADAAMEIISYEAIEASSDLAVERGKYQTYEGSLWSQGILPFDAMLKFKAERGEHFDVDETKQLDWAPLEAKIKKQGMRNSNCLAIAPTATISNICGVSQSIEPTYQNLFVKSNLSGEFSVLNQALVEDLKVLGLWDNVMRNDLKYFDGSVQQIERVPESLKAKYATAFEMDSRWLIEAASRRQKWIDQAQSLNLYLAEPNGKALDNLYKFAWLKGLKTTYYLRSLGATHMEKTEALSAPVAPKFCAIDDPECDACQ